MKFLRYRKIDFDNDNRDNDVLNISFGIGKLGFFYGKWKNKKSWKDHKYNHKTWHFCNVDKEKQVYHWWYRFCYKSRFFEVSLLK
jgi:hypothetical protein